MIFNKDFVLRRFFASPIVFRLLLGAAVLTGERLAAPPATAFAAENGADKKDEIPAPEDVPLETKDGLRLRSTFYPGIHGKATVPIVIVHDFKGRRTEFHELALYLQKNGGHAVIVPDLRGHGESTTYRSQNGTDEKIDASRLRAAAFAAMSGIDLQKVKSFLREKNNAGELNLDQLCVIGVGPMGSVVALNWALIDWEQKQYLGAKLGQDVKALALVSPVVSYEGLKASDALKHPVVGGRLATLLIGGKKDKDGLESIYRQLDKQHRKPANDADKDLFRIAKDTEVRGAKLLDPTLGLDLDKTLLNFIRLKIVSKQADFLWSERKDVK